MRLNDEELKEFRKFILDKKMSVSDIIESLPVGLNYEFNDILDNLLAVSSILSYLDDIPENEKLLSDIKKDNCSIPYFSELYDFLMSRLGVSNE